MAAVYMYLTGNASAPAPAAVTQGFRACLGLASALLALAILGFASLRADVQDRARCAPVIVLHVYWMSSYSAARRER
jgi:hypothetical protein